MGIYHSPNFPPGQNKYQLRTKFIFKDQNDLISLRIDGCENEN
jgi:hypothetical protein